MKFLNVKSENIDIDGIPAIFLRPDLKLDVYPTVVFYHGWSSKKEYQEFRGSIIASLGYQVIIPDAIHHGDRGQLDYDASENSGFFWRVVLANLDEWSKIKAHAVEKLRTDPGRLAVAGHSMGGFTSAGIFAENTDIRTCVILNGSFNWLDSNEEFKRRLNVHMTKEFQELEQQVKDRNPAGNMDSLLDRPILILHGEADSMVEISPQREFYERLRELHRAEGDLKMVSYKNLDHFVTTNMLEEMGKWLDNKMVEE
ncbi:MAG: alpha/beta fold hydrolase [Gudongella sp.]|nr:alpha/beta fold hydrolase [Gudongella sp.]